jgi:hypothetical protein
MSTLLDLILACTAVRGYDRLVLLGWAYQLEEDNSTAYSSKTTVGEWAGVSEDTVRRYTKRLVKRGIMIPTGETKVWTPKCQTPVYKIDIQKIMDLAHGGAISTPTADSMGVLVAAQGSNASTVSVIGSPSFVKTDAATTTPTTGLRPAAGEERFKPFLKPENLEPDNQDQNPHRSLPLPKKRKSCPYGCGAELKRDEDHLRVCPVANATPPVEPTKPSYAPDSDLDFPDDLCPDCHKWVPSLTLHRPLCKARGDGSMAYFKSLTKEEYDNL